MQNPNLLIHWPAILTSVVVAFIFGFLWYGPLFGKTWAKLMGFSTDQVPEFKAMAPSLVMQVIGVFLTTYVLAHSGQVWRPSVWGVGQDDASFGYGLYCGFFTWLGFYVPMQLGKVSWEMRPWKLFFLNTTYDFLLLQIISQILANWR